MCRHAHALAGFFCDLANPSVRIVHTRMHTKKRGSEKTNRVGDRERERESGIERERERVGRRERERERKMVGVCTQLRRVQVIPENMEARLCRA